LVYFSPFWCVCCTEKNLATLLPTFWKGIWQTELKGKQIAKIAADGIFSSDSSPVQGCQIFLRTYNIPKWQKITKWPQNIPYCHSIFQMAVKCTKCKAYKHFSFQGPSKIWPNRDFRYANIGTIWQPWPSQHVWCIEYFSLHTYLQETTKVYIRISRYLLCPNIFFLNGTF
jgi:hypothetical protein